MSDGRQIWDPGMRRWRPYDAALAVLIMTLWGEAYIDGVPLDGDA